MSLMKHFSSLLLLVAITFSVAAQDSISAVDKYTMPQGRWSINFTWAPYSMGWTHIDATGNNMYSGFGVFGASLGAEYVYRENRSIRMDALAVALGHYNYHIGCGGERTIPWRGVNSVSANALNMFYWRRWSVGAGISFEYRSESFDALDIAENPADIDLSKGDRNLLSHCGEYSYDMKHYSLGVLAEANFRIASDFSFGLRYSPRWVLKSTFHYTAKDCPVSDAGVAQTGNIEHQLSFVINWRFDLTKRTKIKY